MHYTVVYEIKINIEKKKFLYEIKINIDKKIFVAKRQIFLTPG